MPRSRLFSCIGCYSPIFNSTLSTQQFIEQLAIEGAEKSGQVEITLEWQKAILSLRRLLDMSDCLVISYWNLLDHRILIYILFLLVIAPPEAPVDQHWSCHKIHDASPSWLHLDNHKLCAMLLYQCSTIIPLLSLWCLSYNIAACQGRHEILLTMCGVLCLMPFCICWVWNSSAMDEFSYLLPFHIAGMKSTNDRWVFVFGAVLHMLDDSAAWKSTFTIHTTVRLEYNIFPLLMIEKIEIKFFKELQLFGLLISILTVRIFTLINVVIHCHIFYCKKLPF